MQCVACVLLGVVQFWDNSFCTVACMHVVSWVVGVQVGNTSEWAALAVAHTCCGLHQSLLLAKPSSGSCTTTNTAVGVVCVPAAENKVSVAAALGGKQSRMRQGCSRETALSGGCVVLRPIPGVAKQP